MLQNKKTFYLILFLLAAGTGALILFLETGGVEQGLWRDVAKLNFDWKGYGIGLKLSREQGRTAEHNKEPGAYPGTIKFSDNGLFVVADKRSNRVVVVYEAHDNMSSEGFKDLIGSLMLAFQEPTTIAHDKTIYWAFGPGGKIDEQSFQRLTETKNKAPVLITVKLQSSEPISAITSGKSQKTDTYLIFSSGPILEQLHPKP